MQSWDAEFGPPRPRYLIGIELSTGRIMPLADADFLAWAQAHVIQIVASMRAGSGGGTLVVLHVASGQVRDRVTVGPGGPPHG